MKEIARRNRMAPLHKYIDRAHAMGMSRAKIIDVSSVVTGYWVRMKCQFGCGCYGTRWTCPPYSPTPEYTKNMLAEYSKGLLMQIEDIPAKKEPKIRAQLEHCVADLERELFLDGYYKAFGMAAGPCRLCRTCDITHYCKYPEHARPAMEACGIDVYQTARNNDFTLEVVKSEDVCCSYVALILIE
jgi:predicted metal-binding protein